MAITDEQVEDIIGTKLIGGDNVTVTYDDTTGQTTIDAESGDSSLPPISISQNEDIETQQQWDTYGEHTVTATLTAQHIFTLPLISNAGQET